MVLLEVLERGEMCHHTSYFDTAFKMFVFPWEGITRLR